MFVQTKELSGFDSLVPELVYFVDRNALPTWRIPEHTIDFHDLTWIQSGTASYRCDSQTVVAHAGDLLYLPQGSRRAAHTSAADPMHSLAINFISQPPPGGLSPNLPLPLHSTIGFPEELVEMYRTLNRIWLEKAPGHRLEARGILILIIHCILKRQLSGPRDTHQAHRLAVIQDHVLQHYAQAIDVKQLAELVHLNPVYCGAWFRATTGLTVKQYINRIRVSKAADLLSTGGFRVGEAAAKCGFEDLYYFSKVFKQIIGYPPSRLIQGQGETVEGLEQSSPSKPGAHTRNKNSTKGML